jgi:hypothetical protein
LPNTYLHMSVFNVLPSGVNIFFPTFWKHPDALFKKGLWLAACLHTNQSWSYLNHLVYSVVFKYSILYPYHKFPSRCINIIWELMYSGVYTWMLNRWLIYILYKYNKIIYPLVVFDSAPKTIIMYNTMGVAYLKTIVQTYLCTATSETLFSSTVHTALYSLLMHLVHYKHP